MRPPKDTTLADRSGTKAFTLIELLVVIGLITLLAGGAGIALHDGGGNRLAVAQTTLAGIVAAARAQAVVHQTEARLLICAERPPSGDPERFLRCLQVVRAEPVGSGNWRAVGAPVFLPRDVFILPNSTAGLLGPGVAWTEGASSVSTFGGGTFSPVLEEGAFGAAHWLEFGPEGSVRGGDDDRAGASHRLVLTVGRNENGLPQFSLPRQVRGLRLRATGAVSFLNDLEAF